MLCVVLRAVTDQLGCVSEELSHEPVPGGWGVQLRTTFYQLQPRCNVRQLMYLLEWEAMT